MPNIPITPRYSIADFEGSTCLPWTVMNNSWLGLFLDPILYYTSTKSWKVIFSVQFVSVCVCLSGWLALLVNKIPVEQMNRFGRGFR